MPGRCLVRPSVKCAPPPDTIGAPPGTEAGIQRAGGGVAGPLVAAHSWRELSAHSAHLVLTEAANREDLVDSEERVLAEAPAGWSERSLVRYASGPVAVVHPGLGVDELEARYQSPEVRSDESDESIAQCRRSCMSGG